MLWIQKQDGSLFAIDGVKQQKEGPQVKLLYLQSGRAVHKEIGTEDAAKLRLAELAAVVQREGIIFKVFPG
jgi:hypothetical protein